MTVWEAIITQIGLAVRKIAGPVIAFFAGKKAQKEKERAKDDKAKIDDLERRLDAARDIDAASRDDAERQRVRDKYTRPDPPAG